MQNFDLKGRLSGITIPVLVTAGKQDWIIPAEYGKSIAEEVPNAIFVLFENYGHSLVREQGNIYKNLVRQFLRNELHEKEIIVEVE